MVSLRRRSHPFTRPNRLGAVNPRDSDLNITSDGDEIVFNGHKNFNTGGVVSDLTILEGVLEGTTDHIFTAVHTKQEGFKFAVSSPTVEKIHSSQR